MMAFGPGVGLLNRRRRAVAAFSPLDIAGLQLWLDSSNLSSLYQDASRTTPVASDADVVGAMSDLSGNGRHATQATTANKPTYRAAVKNGRGVVRFDGVDDEFGLASTIAANANWTSIAVYKKRTAAVKWLGLTNASSAGGPYTHAEWSDGNYYIGNHANYWYASVNYNTFVLASSSVSSGVFSLAVNGGAALSLTGPTALAGQTTFSSVNRRGTTYGDGDLAEILIYSSALSTTNRQAVESYLNSKWAVY